MNDEYKQLKKYSYELREKREIIEYIMLDCGIVRSSIFDIQICV